MNRALGQLAGSGESGGWPSEVRQPPGECQGADVGGELLGVAVDAADPALEVAVLAQLLEQLLGLFQDQLGLLGESAGFERPSRSIISAQRVRQRGQASAFGGLQAELLADQVGPRAIIGLTTELVAVPGGLVLAFNDVFGPRASQAERRPSSTASGNDSPSAIDGPLQGFACGRRGIG